MTHPDPKTPVNPPAPAVTPPEAKDVAGEQKPPPHTAYLDPCLQEFTERARRELAEQARRQEGSQRTP